MKGGLTPQGFTILETMIFLSVSLVLLAAALGSIYGQQQRTEFSQAINDINSKVQDVINDTATGFYPSFGSFTCQAIGGPTPRPHFNSSASAQGTNDACIFVGKAMHFIGNGIANSDKFYIYTVAGLRLNSSQQQVQSLAEAQPRVVYDPSVPVDLTETDQLENSLVVTAMYKKNGAIVTAIGTVGFFTTFGQYGSNNDLLSGAQTTNVVAIPSSDITQDELTAATAINNSGTNVNPATDINPDGGVTICFLGGNGQKAAIVIGSNGRTTATNLVIGQPAGGACP